MRSLNSELDIPTAILSIAARILQTRP